jgi:hypothetical protein
LNFVLATAMLVGLIVGTPPVTVVAGAMVFVTVASVIAVAIQN